MKTLTIEASVDGWFIGDGALDDSGFISVSDVERAREYLERAHGATDVDLNVGDEAIAIILASLTRKDTNP